MYENTIALKHCTINERIHYAEQTGIDLLNKGWSVDLIKYAIDGFEKKEEFEMAQGLKNALETVNN